MKDEIVNMDWVKSQSTGFCIRAHLRLQRLGLRRHRALRALDARHDRCRRAHTVLGGGHARGQRVVDVAARQIGETRVQVLVRRDNVGRDPRRVCGAARGRSNEMRAGMRDWKNMKCTHKIVR